MEEIDWKNRLQIWALDMLVIVASVLVACALVGGVVHLFRLWHTGHYLLRALVQSSSFLERALWPTLILIGFVVFRRQILNALNEVPFLIKHYSPYEKIADGSGAEACQESVHGEVKEALNQKHGSSKGNPLSTRDIGRMFEDYVVRCLQVELGVTVARNVMLFNNRMLRFDGVIVRGDMITAVEVMFGRSLGSLERSLLQFARFYRSISQRDQEHFNMMVCLTTAMRAQSPRLVAFRESLPFPIEYRFFDESMDAQG